MNSTIWKFPIQTEDEQEITMPEGASILTVQMQGEMPCLWALVDPEASARQVTILTAGTGHNREDLGGHVSYIGTYQMMGGALIFHVFEKLA